MSRGRIRRNEYYATAVSLLTEAGLSWREELGGKHGKIFVSAGGCEHLLTITGSPGDRRGIMNFTADVRRRIKQWKAEGVASLATETPPAQFPTLEKRTMDDSMGDVVLHDVRGEPRALDTDIGARLGLSRPRAIRQTIERNSEELERFGPLATRRGKSRGQEFTEYFLNEEQALLVSTLSEAPRAADVRHMLIKVFVAWRRGQLQVPAEWDRVVGMMKMLARKTTENEKALADIQNYLTNPGGSLVPSFDMGGSVTALDIIILAGIKADQRVKGTSAAVTLRMKDFCLVNGFTSMKTPVAIDTSARWRFQREAAQQWLFGPTSGAEFIRAHVAKRREEKGASGQLSLILGGRS